MVPKIWVCKRCRKRKKMGNNGLPSGWEQTNKGNFCEKCKKYIL